MDTVMRHDTQDVRDEPGKPPRATLRKGFGANQSTDARFTGQRVASR